jgi:mono/diheme cytochrome c family protein
MFTRIGLLRTLISTVLTIGLTRCAKGGEGPPATGSSTPAAGGDLTPFQLENGLGPVTQVVEVGPAIEEEMAEAGQQVFQTKCSACHKMGEKYVGPALGEVTTRRTPAYILNMILNPQEMVERHPVAKQLLAEHMSFMPNQGLTPDEARQVLEYLRTQSKGVAQ